MAKKSLKTESDDAQETINLPTYEQAMMLEAFIKSMPRVVVKKDDDYWDKLVLVNEKVHMIRMYLFVETSYNTLDGFLKDVEDLIETKFGIPKDYFLLTGQRFETEGNYDRIRLQIDFYTNKIESYG